MHCKKITSASNQVIKETLREKQHRQPDRFLIEGHHLLEMAIASGTEIVRVFFTTEYSSKNDIFLGQISKNGAELIETTDYILSKISDTETPQGIVALARYKTLQLDELRLKADPLIVITDGIQDPGNLGTIIRTSDAAGADAVIMLPDTCDAFMPKAIRATAGSIFNIPIIYSYADMLVKWLREENINLFVTDVKASEIIYKADLTEPLAFVFGNEAHGVSEKLKDEADMLINIPIMGRAESLNVATSAAICLYEAIRQRALPS